MARLPIVAVIAALAVACGARTGIDQEAEPGWTDVVEVVAGWFHTCALRGSGEVLCWGDWNGDRNDDALVPAPFPGVEDAVDLSARSRTCVVRRDGRVSCWGYSVDDCDDDVPVPERDRAADVDGLLDPAVEVAVGRSVICARLASGDVTCFDEQAPDCRPPALDVRSGPRSRRCSRHRSTNTRYGVRSRLDSGNTA